MRPALALAQLLDNYLHNRLSEEERVEVEIRLLWDREWQRLLEVQKPAYQALRLAGRQQLRQELAAIHTKLFG